MYLAQWQGAFAVSSMKGGLVFESSFKYSYFYIFFKSYSVVLEYDILDPHPAAALDNNKLNKFNERYRKERQYHW